MRVSHTNQLPVTCSKCGWGGDRVYVVEGEETKQRPVAGWGPCPDCGGVLQRKPRGTKNWNQTREERRLEVQRQMKELK